MSETLAPTTTPNAETKKDVIRLGNLFSVADQIQALCLAQKTAEIRLVNVVPSGSLFIVEGEVMHAQFGNRTGLEAAISLVNLRDPDSEIYSGALPRARTIHLGFVHILLEAAGRKDETLSGEYPSVEAALAPAPAMLQVILPDRTIQHALEEGLTLIGRSPFNDIVIPDETVSKRHASIAVSSGGVLLRDLDSTNGTFVEGQQVSDWHLIGLTHLMFGHMDAYFTPPPEREKQP